MEHQGRHLPWRVPNGRATACMGQVAGESKEPLQAESIRPCVERHGLDAVKRLTGKAMGCAPKSLRTPSLMMPSTSSRGARRFPRICHTETRASRPSGIAW